MVKELVDSYVVLRKARYVTYRSQPSRSASSEMARSTESVGGETT